MKHAAAGGHYGYLSCRLALPGASFVKVSEEAGNNEVILRRFYDRPAATADAREYFAIRPSRIGRRPSVTASPSSVTPPKKSFISS